MNGLIMYPDTLNSLDEVDVAWFGLVCNIFRKENPSVFLITWKQHKQNENNNVREEVGRKYGNMFCRNIYALNVVPGPDFVCGLSDKNSLSFPGVKTSQEVAFFAVDNKSPL